MIELDGQTIKKVNFVFGCVGSLQGIASLVKGMEIEEVIEKLEGIHCRNGTSCPDQLAKALKQYLSNRQKQII
jgi:uncharacterized protein (TIGR03905 family)